MTDEISMSSRRIHHEGARYEGAKDGIQLIAVDPVMIDKLWMVALPYLAKSYRRSSMQVPVELIADLKWKKKVLWLAVSGEEEIVGAGTTGLYMLADGAKMCKIEHFGADGGLKNWFALRHTIERYARDEKCDRVMVEARLGLARYLDDYDEIAVILEKRL
jgi:hypothetical protein